MSSIPEPLIFEFLIRLPVKSLSRFKCINKSCYSLISDPFFIYTHLKRAKAEANHPCLLTTGILQDNFRSATTIYFFIVGDNDQPAVLTYSAQVSFDSYHVLPSCNGLVCFYGANAGTHICNPTTKNTTRLPESNDTAADHFRLLSCGFGFDEQTCSYKVIKILESFRSGQMIEVFTMGANSWRKVKYNPRFCFLNRQPPVFASGFFHWITVHSINYASSGFIITSFDIGSETFNVINPPGSVSAKDWRMLYLQELGGNLCLIDTDFEFEGNKRIDVWLLKWDSNNELIWVQETILHQSEPLDATRPVAIHGKEILLHGFIKELDYLNWYNLETKSFRRVDVKGMYTPYFHVCDHVESLVPLNGT